MLDISTLVLKEQDLTETITFALSPDAIDFEEESSAEEQFSLDELNRIDLEEILGEGGMGVVFSGQQHYPQRKVAIKLLKGERISLQLRLMQEAMITGRLEHPNIPPVYQIRKNQENKPEVVFRKIEGHTFREQLDNDRSKENGLLEGIRILIQVCHAVEYAHSIGILHRDIKPENIMLGKFNQVYLMDWGIAVDLKGLEQAEKGFVGTPAYMAPEMLLGDPVQLSETTDIYLLGATLHKILTGKRRNIGDSVKEIVGFLQNCESFLYAEDLPEILTNLCNQSCSKDSETRPTSVRIFREKLEEFLYYRGALELVERGKQKLRQYQKLVQTGSGSLTLDENLEYDDIFLHKTSEKAKNLFEQALELWPESQKAKDGLDAIVALMIERAIDTNEFKRAEILHTEFHAKDTRPDLEKEIASAKEQWKQERKQVAFMQKKYEDIDPSVTTAPRILLRSIFLFSVLTSLIVFGSWQILGGFTFSSGERALLVLFPVLTVWGGIGVLYSGLKVNEFGKQAVLVIFLLTFGITANLGLGWFLEVSPRVSDVLSCLILAIILMTSAPAIRRGAFLGKILFVLTLMGAFFLEFSHYFFYLGALLIAGEIFTGWEKEEPDPSEDKNIFSA